MKFLIEARQKLGQICHFIFSLSIRTVHPLFVRLRQTFGESFLDAFEQVEESQK